MDTSMESQNVAITDVCSSVHHELQEMDCRRKELDPDTLHATVWEI